MRFSIPKTWLGGVFFVVVFVCGFFLVFVFVFVSVCGFVCFVLFHFWGVWCFFFFLSGNLKYLLPGSIFVSLRKVARLSY